MKKLIFLCLLSLGVLSASAKVTLPSILGNGMVMQRNTTTNIWGKAAPEAKVTVITSWNSKQYDATADSDGKWLVAVKTPEAGGPYVISISDGEELILDNILIGEVWICSGQSNMEMQLRGGLDERVAGSMEAQLGAAKYPGLRMFTVTKAYSDQQQENCEGAWKYSTPGNAGDFSAIGWFFGTTLADALHIPIGMINTSWGGTLIEPWISGSKIETIKDIVSVDPNLIKAYPQQAPAVLYNGMIAPIEHFAARGFLWYQGESNRHNPQVYDKLMEGLVTSWRSAWNNDAMPFYFVELAPFVYEDPRGIDLCLVKEAQHRAVGMIPLTAIAGTIDAGDSISIHPPYKCLAAKRLALHALANDYGIAGLDHMSPVMESVEYVDGKALVRFANADRGFSFEGDVSAFELAGEDRVFYPAKARVVTYKTMVEVSCDQVPNPVAVRYGFRNWCVGNLYNTAGIPALPFRTDNWDDVK